MSTSSKLRNIINLEGKKVLLKENKGKKLKTKYTVQAIKENNNIILLNLNYINELFYIQVLKSNSDIVREQKINNNLKVDFLDKITGELIEVKGIISENKSVIFPTMKTERFTKQLKEFKKIRNNVRLVIILMNPKINRIIFNKQYKQFYEIFESCIKVGMKIEVYKASYEEKISLKKLKFIIDKDCIVIL